VDLPHQMPLFNRQSSNNFPSYPSPPLINSKEEDGEEQHDQQQQQQPEDSIDLGDSVSLIASSINDDTDTDNPISDTISLVLSANDGDIETVTHLLNLGISIESLDEDGSTPLIAASFGSNSSPQTLEIIKLLLSRGANIFSIQEKHGWTPIIAASYVGSAQTLELLLTYDIKNEKNEEEINKKKDTTYERKSIKSIGSTTSLITLSMIKHRDKLGKDAMQYVCDNILETSKMLQGGFNYQSAYFAFIEAKEDALRNELHFNDESFILPNPEEGEENLTDTLDRHLACKALLNKAIERLSNRASRKNVSNDTTSTMNETDSKKEDNDNDDDDDMNDVLIKTRKEEKEHDMTDLLSSSSITTVLGSSSSSSIHLIPSSITASSAIKTRASLGRQSLTRRSGGGGGGGRGGGGRVNTYLSSSHSGNDLVHLNSHLSVSAAIARQDIDTNHIQNTESSSSSSSSSSSLSSSLLKRKSISTTHIQDKKPIDESLAKAWALVPFFYLIFLFYKWLWQE
jgi:ankyrin repeat protein